MAEPFLGEIRMWGLNFAPRDWAFCEGALLGISGNQALYSLIGTQFGGDGRTNFGLPDLRGRAPIHIGGGFPVAPGFKGGQENVTLDTNSMPPHSHSLNATTATANQHASG